MTMPYIRLDLMCDGLSGNRWGVNINISVYQKKDGELGGENVATTDTILFCHNSYATICCIAGTVLKCRHL